MTRPRDSSRCRLRSPARRRMPYGPQTEDYAKILAWQAQEQTFMLAQAKRRAELRVHHGRGAPIDALAVHLRIVDSSEGLCDEQPLHAEVALCDPVALIESLAPAALATLQTEVEQYLSWETRPANIAFWEAVQVMCQEAGAQQAETGRYALARSVAEQIKALLAKKTLSELSVLEEHVAAKLAGGGLVDVDYWSKLRDSLKVWKARLTLRAMHTQILERRREALKEQQLREGRMDREALKNRFNRSLVKALDETTRNLDLSGDLDPLALDAAPALASTLAQESILPTLTRWTEAEWMGKLEADRDRVRRAGFVPLRPVREAMAGPESAADNSGAALGTASREGLGEGDALYEREAARGENDDEEVFNVDEAIVQARPSWADQYPPRKPRFFNRVQMGYDWNRYNQVHYDANHPPPKVIQGYKFNIFYPDLIDKSKAPTYRIERDRSSRGQSTGVEEETCLIRFMAGPPYEDVAFRIIDKDWDYSAKRERGFRSSFDKGVLHLSFQFKKVFYRK